MRIIADLVRFMKDEAKSVKLYGDMAIKLKGEHKELADLMWNMANTEATHLDGLHAWLVKYIEKEKKERVEPIPQGMLDVWDWEHEQMIEDMREYKLNLQNYTKM